jgi:hypothetical protein
MIKLGPLQIALEKLFILFSLILKNLCLYETELPKNSLQKSIIFFWIVKALRLLI